MPQEKTKYKNKRTKSPETLCSLLPKFHIYIRLNFALGAHNLL